MQSTFGQCSSNTHRISRQPCSSYLTQRYQFITADIFSLALYKAIKKNGALPTAVCDEHAIAAGSAMACSRDSELDDFAAEFRIDESALGPRDQLAQSGVGYSFVSGKAREPSSFENPQSPSTLKHE
jgi:hypothetical protein